MQEIVIPDPVAVRDLAAALGLQPYRVIALLMEFDRFVTASHRLDFATAALVCATCGVIARRADDS